MKKILMLTAVLSILTMLLVAGCGKINPLPEYSLDGITPKVSYGEWDAKYEDWFYLVDPSDATGPIMKIEKFVVDRNKDGVADLKVTYYYMPDGEYRDDLNKTGTHEAYQWMVVFVDDDLDKLWD